MDCCSVYHNTDLNFFEVTCRCFIDNTIVAVAPSSLIKLHSQLFLISKMIDNLVEFVCSFFNKCDILVIYVASPSAYWSRPE